MTAKTITEAQLAAALTGTFIPSEHGQLCPIWIGRRKKVADRGKCNCWVQIEVARISRSAFKALPSGADSLDTSCPDCEHPWAWHADGAPGCFEKGCNCTRADRRRGPYARLASPAEEA